MKRRSPNRGTLFAPCALALWLTATALLRPGTAAAIPGDLPVDSALRSAAEIVADSSSSTGNNLGPGWIEVDDPSESQIVRLPIALVEMRGRVGDNRRGYEDLVIALDRSLSALLPSGLDIDGDGITGTLVDPKLDPDTAPIGSFRTWTTDPDDIVVEASIRAVRQLLKSLDPRRTRVALVTFSGDAKLVAPLGPVSLALEALNRVPIQEDYTGSNLAAPIQQGLWELNKYQPLGRPSQRAILLVSDGLPTEPRNKSFGARRARALAREAKKQGVRVYTFEMSHIEDPDENDSRVLSTMATLGGGRWLRIDRPAALRFELPNRGGKVEGLEIVNETSGEAARAVRVFANGSFDAFLPLRSGENRIHILARLPGGRTVEAERSIEYEPADPSPADAKKVESLLKDLRLRTRETENLLPIRRPADSRVLTINPEPEKSEPGDAPQPAPAPAPVPATEPTAPAQP